MLKKEEIISSIKKRLEEDFSIVGKVGATIKLKRISKHQTLNNLSQLFGVSISYLSKVENDVMKPNIDYLTDVLDDLQINESLITESMEMNKWYDKLIKHVLNIENNQKEITSFFKQRDDFQAKIVKLALNIYSNKFSKIRQSIKLILSSVSLMHSKEFSLFMLSLTSYYIKIEDYFMAGEILKEIDLSYINDQFFYLWFLELKHELALYQSSFVYYINTVNELNNQYFMFNLFDKIKELKERTTAALAYFLEPENFKDYLHDEEMYRSYRLSTIYFKRYEDFEELDEQDDLAQILFDELKGNYDKVKNKWSKVEFKDDPFEQTLKEYFKYKYDFDKLNMFLRETLFASTGLSQHYFSCKFISDILIDTYSKEHKYKQCYLIGQKLKDLEEKRRLYLEDKRI